MRRLTRSRRSASPPLATPGTPSGTHAQQQRDQEDEAGRHARGDAQSLSARLGELCVARRLGERAREALAGHDRLLQLVLGEPLLELLGSGLREQLSL